MNIYNILDKKEYLQEYFELCLKEWGKSMTESQFKETIKNKKEKFLSGNNQKVYTILILVKNTKLVGFVSLLKEDGPECKNLTPWYATMYVKDNFRGLGYSKILNEAILNEAKRLKFTKVYLKSNLNNYYEKFGFKYLKKLKNQEKIYFTNL